MFESKNIKNEMRFWQVIGDRQVMESIRNVILITSTEVVERNGIKTVDWQKGFHIQAV